MLRQENDTAHRHELALSDEVAATSALYPDRSLATRYDRELAVVVDRPKARCSSWYEFFPRSCSAEAGRHGTLRDAETRLQYAASMGFDVVYLPPVHPIGTSFRKGKNNAPEPGPKTSAARGPSERLRAANAIHPALGSFPDSIASFPRPPDWAWKLPST